MNEPSQPTIAFEEFEIDTFHRRLLRRGEPVVMTAKTFDVLAFLIENNGRVVAKDEILDSVWGDRFVEESNLVVQISNLRRILGETPNAPRFLATIPGKGYKFAAETGQNSFVLETHTVSELTIEHQEIALPVRRASTLNRKWFAAAALMLLSIGAFGYWRFQPSNAKGNFASGWTDSARRASPRQLTANGKIGLAAISPDGTLYAYTNEGSETSGLWVSGINSSQNVQVLEPAAIIFTGLTFSPDGLHIYYTASNEQNRQNTVFRVPTLGGRSEKILSNICCAPTFSPDGKQIAFVRSGPNKSTALIAANLQTKEEKTIAVRQEEFAFNDNGASWSPDGTKIAVGGIDENTKENGVLLVDVNTGVAEKFGEKGWNYVRRVEWMRDGSALLVNVVEKDSWQERQIWMIEYPSGKAHRVSNDSNRYGRETVSISADGSKLIGVNAQSVSNIYVGQANDLSNLKNITNHGVGKRDGFFNSLAWTPDGRIVFMRFFDKSDSLWIMDADGSNAKQLTQSGKLDRKPVITSDNRYVVFYSNTADKYDVWRVGLDGSDLKQITFDGGSAPSVTPDSRWIYYQRDGRIWKVSIDGGASTQITNIPSKAAEISPDGKRLACFIRPESGGKLKLAVFAIDGGEPLQTFDVPVDLLYEKLRWTPDGDSLVYAFYNSIAWRQSLAGVDPVKFLEFPDETINAFSWSPDGKQFAVAHGEELRDVVLFSVDR